MVRVGGGWCALDEFLVKNDPCRGIINNNIEAGTKAGEFNNKGGRGFKLNEYFFKLKGRFTDHDDSPDSVANARAEAARLTRLIISHSRRKISVPFSYNQS